jgi:UDP-N-acetylglucosamine 2-epimerase (non-hydrolysing)
MLKVMTIVGTRPELIKMSRVIAELDKHTKHVLVHTGQNYDYELNQIFFDDLQIDTKKISKVLFYEDYSKNEFLI